MRGQALSDRPPPWRFVGDDKVFVLDSVDSSQLALSGRTEGGLTRMGISFRDGPFLIPS